jgi:hypothetical protein
LIDEQHRRLGAIPKDQRRGRSVKDAHVAPTRSNQPLQRACDVPVTGCSRGHDGEAESTSRSIGVAHALRHPKRAVRLSTPNQRHRRIREERAAQ